MSGSMEEGSLKISDQWSTVPLIRNIDSVFSLLFAIDKASIL